MGLCLVGGRGVTVEVFLLTPYRYARGAAAKTTTEVAAPCECTENYEYATLANIAALQLWYII